MRRKLAYNPARDYYAILGIETAATTEDVRRAYRRRVLACHPDRNPDRVEWATDQIQLVNEAYDVLRQPHLRREYDRLRWPHVPQQPRPRPSYRAYTAPAPDPARPWWNRPPLTPRPGRPRRRLPARRFGWKCRPGCAITASARWTRPG